MAGNPSLMEVNYLDIMTRNLCVGGCPHATRSDVRRTAQFVADGALDIDQFVTHRFRLPDVRQAMKTIMLRSGCPALVALDVAANGQDAGDDQPTTTN
jgi:threonine dehydrogenase-like Zn-dependent dehydrogenase